MDSIRIDKWLWAVRLFKTRSLAADACRGGKVKFEGQNIKPAREIKVGDVIHVQQGIVHKVVEVKQVIKNRVGAPLAALAYDDLTPSEEYDKLQMMKSVNSEFRPRGEGRPTKKNRRMIDILKNEEDDDD
ncbi:MAG: RNA-binding S4 domain-containing protein [Hyphomicrobiales bacterium]